MPHSTSDAQVAQRFAEHLSRGGDTYSVVPAADPPDFLLEPGTWLELSDIYLSDAEAKFLNSPKETKFSFHGSPADPALRLLQKLDEKLAKSSYERIFEERGAGFVAHLPRLLFRRREFSSCSRGARRLSAHRQSWLFQNCLFRVYATRR